jgi:hypothetical protein
MDDREDGVKRFGVSTLLDASPKESSENARHLILNYYLSTMAPGTRSRTT